VGPPTLRFFVPAPAQRPSAGRIVSPANASWAWPDRHRWAAQWREATDEAISAWRFAAGRERQLAARALMGQPAARPPHRPPPRATPGQR
jgi:hypothetical protein